MPVDAEGARAARAVLALALLVFVSAAALPGDEPAERLVLSSDLQVRVHSGRYIELEVRVADGEGYAEAARRVTASADRAPAIEAWNPRGASADGFVRVPLAFLSDEYRALVLLRLFPEDHRDGEDWIHVTRAGLIPTYDEGLWQVAEWFTGKGSRFTEIQKANGLASPELSAGQTIRIPRALVHPSLNAGRRSDDGLLVYGSDDRGTYAGYRLQAGEALYSAVVVRFTGRTSADDVNELADELVRRSDIRDPRDIPVGYLVKIPLEVLEPEFLPPDHARRRQAEAERAAMAAALARRPVGETRRGLEGVLVILDPGHGGRDLGTMNHGIWEHDYVYDVACRLKDKLERTRARVFLTLEDAKEGCVPSRGDRLSANHQGTVKTKPPFLARAEGEARVAVNLRWYLSNSVFRKAVREGADADRIVFVSLHADARHPSLRGVMVYVPGARFRSGSYGRDTATYRRFEEVREKPRVRFSQKQLIRAEAVSRKLANEIVEAFSSGDLPVQSFKPVRDSVIRGRHRWLPAVLRGNAVPTTVLVEMVNMANGRDAGLLSSADRRDAMADALFRGLFSYFGEQPPSGDLSTSSR